MNVAISKSENNVTCANNSARILLFIKQFDDTSYILIGNYFVIWLFFEVMFYNRLIRIVFKNVLVRRKHQVIMLEQSNNGKSI